MRISGRDLTAIISVKIEDPQFEGQTKQKLGNSEASGAVDSIVSDTAGRFSWSRIHSVAKMTVEKSIAGTACKGGSQKGKGSYQKKICPGGNVPAGKTGRLFGQGSGKLRDLHRRGRFCRRFREDGQRPVSTQAILPLRGKILNVEKARLDKIYGNAEIKAMITAFGTGIHEDFDITKLRYHKIIIMTDADVDGAHISTLLLTFLYRFMPDLIKQGYVYLAQPPLYKLEKNKKVWYAYSDEELNQILTEKWDVTETIRSSVIKVLERWMRSSCGRPPWIRNTEFC